MRVARPNILVVMGDDHAQWAAGCYGSREIRTPTIDYLAASGVRFANAYAPNPVCSPARASFFTGRLPSQHGIHDYIRERMMPYDGNWLKNETTMAELLSDSGYQTGLVGKWHCGNGHLPQPGFDYWLSYEYGQWPHLGEVRFVEGERPFVHHGHQSPFLTSKAVEFLRSRDRSCPFFLFVGYVDTHSPFGEHPERLVAPYRASTFMDVPEERRPERDGWVRWGVPDDEQERREWLAQYYAGVTMLDEQLGRLLDEIEGGEHANTLVLFTSDQGHMNGHHGLYASGNATVPQNFYEEAIRVPLVLRWPERLAAGRVCEAAVDHLDLFQTVLDAAGCPPSPELAEERRYPGRSVLPLLDDPDRTAWRQAQFCEYGNARMIRTDQYKLIRRYAPHAGVYPDELYNLVTDPRETTNLIGDAPLASLVRELDAQLDAHFARYEQSEHSARRILSQPPFNSGEPWRLDRPPGEIPQEGAHMITLRHLTPIQQEE